jgi:hypothetical protein
MLDVITRAAISVASQIDEAWVCWGLTDQSFEERDTNSAIRAAIASYVSAGLPPRVADAMRLGINGNLESQLKLHSKLGTCANQRVADKSRPDIRLLNSSGESAALVESKLVFDCTTLKYYPKIAADWTKIVGYRTTFPTARLFLVVFFLQLPFYEYLEGLGSRQCIRRGIAQQYQQLRSVLNQKPVWPGDGIFVRPLATIVDADVRNAVCNRFDVAWQLKGKSFQLERQLRDAAVGFAIWEQS